MPIVVIILGVVIVALGAAVFLVPKPAETPATTVTKTEEVNRTETMEAAEEVATTETMSETDSSLVTRTGNGTYLTPARTEHKLAVTFTLDGSTVTDAQVSYDDGDGYSNPNQERFDKAYKTLVIGKSIKEISLSRVGGASLTSQAFNEAVAEIAASLPS